MSTATGIGTVAFADLGMEAWSTTRTIGRDPVGGVIYAVTETPNYETGEIDRALRCVYFASRGLRWSTLKESELGPKSVKVTDLASIQELCRALATEIVWSDSRINGRRRKAAPDTYEVQCAQALTTLVGVLGLGDERAHCQRRLDTYAVTAMWRTLAEQIAKAMDGPFTTDMAQRAFAIEELQLLVYGPDGALYGELAPKSPGKPVAPRPSYPPAPASMFVD